MLRLLPIALLAACWGAPRADFAAVTAADFTDAEGRLICPVMGDVIASKADAVAHAEFEGKTYWFCCDSCQYMFADAPDKYADGRFIAHLDEAHEGRFTGCYH